MHGVNMLRSVSSWTRSVLVLAFAVALVHCGSSRAKPIPAKVSSGAGLLVVENLSDDTLEDLQISIRSGSDQPVYIASYGKVEPKRSLRATLHNFADSSGHRWDALAFKIFDVKIECSIRGQHAESVFHLS
jgi:hypothetical protein